MALQFGLTYSTKKARPSYIYSIIGVALVLFLLGLLGIIVINAKKLSDFFKENVEVSVILMNDVSPEGAINLKQKLDRASWVKSSEYVSKELALQRFKQQSGEDFMELLEYNPLYASVNYHLNSDAVNMESLRMIEKQILSDKRVKEVYYQKPVVEMMNQNARKVSLVLLAVIVFLFLVALALIDNTIRLVMYSNRFLIKSMQMVGATRWFIARPFIIRSVINGLISGFVAVVLLSFIGIYANSIIPELASLADTGSLFLLLFFVLIVGIIISGLSTYRSVRKYLKLKLDELY